MAEISGSNGNYGGVILDVRTADSTSKAVREQEPETGACFFVPTFVQKVIDHTLIPFSVLVPIHQRHLLLVDLKNSVLRLQLP